MTTGSLRRRNADTMGAPRDEPVIRRVLSFTGLILRIRPVWGLALLFLGCGGHGGGGSTPTPATPPPQISCPSDISVGSVSTATTTVAYDAPTVSGGTAPVQASCNPTSGSSFPLGATMVNCSASDAASRTAACSFRVNLTGFEIGLKKYEAFGDSVTAGEVGRPSISGFNEVDVANAYPTKLQQQFDAVYPGQGVVVINRGHSLDKGDQTDALIRTFAAADRPEVVLLLTGYNDLGHGCGANGAGTATCRDAIGNVGVNVRSCIRRAREVDSALKVVFVSTLTPPGATGSNRIDRNAIVQANDKIRQTVASERAVLVDSYAAFVGHENEYVNVDGLHLTVAGYEALANAFLAAIQSTVQATPLLHAR